jgi:rubrerythrin
LKEVGPMLTKAIKFQIFVLILIVFVQASFVDAQIKYPETINVLQTVYNDEIQAHLTYLAYAQKAISENYPNIAHLFVSLATSESIHARNFKQLLIDLKIELKESPKPEIKVSTTKENLKNATQTELQEIDHGYPQLIEKVRLEGHEAAIRYITYAWESEKQHRELIKKIESGTGILFKMLSGIIEKTPNRYFVCQECGSTITELPKDVCPICKSSVSQYKEVERIK